MVWFLHTVPGDTKAGVIIFQYQLWETELRQTSFSSEKWKYWTQFKRVNFKHIAKKKKNGMVRRFQKLKGSLKVSFLTLHSLKSYSLEIMRHQFSSVIHLISFNMLWTSLNTLYLEEFNCCVVFHSMKGSVFT